MSLSGSKEKKMSDESDYYTVLGIPRNSSETDIKKAYVLTEFRQYTFFYTLFDYI